ncbi:glycosyltransferase [Microcoleus sp. FACHB-SPT15]|uniref:glycosyltransferase family 4 protein n=1 Tax=Microcoleus sp. FACHB-SPT15 TaxID=2692830 RepID=UPI00177E0B04|nr:glycosyltransferase [Microcoleus sp. FACHB-SPT15]MBD1806557.1 glycosyltransferase [Microcoleus sp. FACHB-SPT15]
MKIVYIITDLSIGGAQMMLYQLLSRMSRERFTPVVVSLMDNGTVGDRIQALGIPVYTIGMNAGTPALSAMKQLIRLVRQLNPDIVQGWMYHANLAAQVASIFCEQKMPIVWCIQCSIYSLAFEKKLTAVIIRLCAYLSKLDTNVVHVSKISKIQHEALGYSKSNSCVIPNGVDTLLFTPSVEARVTVRAELGLPEQACLIGLMARYHAMKDQANFLKAAALVLKEHPDVHFILAGQGIDRQNQALYDLIQELGIYEQIDLLGERTDMPRLTAALDIASLSSSYGEGFPLAVGEAMSCGVPCVVTDIGDSAWMVDKTGRIVPPQNPEALANAWKELINLGAEGRFALGQAARNRAIAHFSLDSVVAQYEALYESVLARKLT